MTKKSRVAIGLVALTIMTLGVGGFLAKAQIGAIINKSPARERPMQRAQEDVLAAFGQVEKALQDGDAVLFTSLLARRAHSGTNAAVKAAYNDPLSRRPEIHIEPIAVCVRGDQAFVLARYDEPASAARSILVRYAREDGAWKIADQTLSEAAPYRAAVYAYLPPDGGAFTHAGLPWRTIGYVGAGASAGVSAPAGASAPPGASRKDGEPAWKVQAIRDEAFLHVRFEANATLPAHESPISAEDAAGMRTGGPAGPPTMVITVTMTDDRQTLVRSTFELQAAATIGSSPAATEAANGGDGQHFLTYSVTLRGDRAETLFASSPGAFDRLIEVRDRFIDVRLPLKSLGLHGRSVPEIELRAVGEPAQPPYRVARFSP
jgi:hypothetical protein